MLRVARNHACLYFGGLAMSKTKGSSDEAIGRPQQWREGRYQRSGQDVDSSVEKSPDANADESPQAVSTPVTQQDYTQLERGAKPQPSATGQPSRKKS
jgi:hypothetical protein